jgi:hypothetical protein
MRTCLAPKSTEHLLHSSLLLLLYALHLLSSSPTDVTHTLLSFCDIHATGCHTDRLSTSTLVIRSQSIVQMPGTMPEEKYKKDSTLTGKICGNCFASKGSASARELSACSRCSLVVYCSRDCQRAHWKINHKLYCIPKAYRAPQLKCPLEV